MSEAAGTEVLAGLAAGLAERDGRQAELRETHMSWVLLTSDRAYKLKKPVRFDFLDLREPEARRRACEEEVRVNRPLAGDIVLGVRAVVPDAVGYALGDAEEAPRAVDWVVEMRRFDEEHTMAAAARRGELRAEDVEATARRIAAFHADAARPPADDWAATVERAWAVNVEELARAAGDVLAPGRIEAARHFAAGFARRRAQELDARAARGRVVDGHGDLRAEHVVLGDGAPTIVDRLEFDELLRRVDVADDLAFLVMDLHAIGAAWAAEVLVGAYRAAGGDPGDEALIAAFAVYRALVRAKVALLRSAQLPSDRAGAAREGGLALVRLAERLAWVARSPLLLVVAGPPASGKSTVARAVAAEAGWPVLSSDVARKELLGVGPGRRAPDAAYTPDARRRVYEVLGARAAEALAEGSVVVDATFGGEEQRDAFLSALGGDADIRVIACEAPEEVRIARARARQEAGSDASDAGPDVARALSGGPVEFPGPASARLVLDTTRPADGVPLQVAAWLDRSA
jgi:aminoglycoside phosphotransferase family enzyme/predicted kinase